MKKTTLTTLIVILSSLSVHAQNENRGSDKVDLKKLEDKYWSAKDEDYGVIQNRTYSKAGKFYGSVVAGTLINDTFAKAKPLGGMLGYYFSEDFGIELSYLNLGAQKNESVEKLNSISTAVSPNYNLVKNSYTISATYTPFYAKMAFMNKSILYFDMGFTLGAGMTNYEQVASPGVGQAEQLFSKSSPHVEIGFMQQLFINKHLAFRMDLKNTFYNSKVRPYQYNGNTANGEESKSTNDTTLTFGVTLFSK